MDTPIFDFAGQYARDGATRAHMPGHKGRGPLGCEALDLTEIKGADSLYEADGIIRQSEDNAAQLFGAARTIYSAEGSSLCIRTMLLLAAMRARQNGESDLWILAARNAHKVFIQTCALLDLDVGWLWDESGSFSLCRSIARPETLERVLRNANHLPIAVYITSPDYLGNENDIRGLAEVAHAYGVPLLVDNAHGAYLKFLPESRHPMSLGADICCDSAHKTFPCLTGSAYLHISPSAPPEFSEFAKQAMAQFGSTSPSYLILESLDRNNRFLAEGYGAELLACVEKINGLKKNLAGMGWQILPSDELKLTVEPRGMGYTGDSLSDLLANHRIICEYSDPDNTVLMLTPSNTDEDFERILRAFSEIPPETKSESPTLKLPRPEVYCSPRQTLFAPRKCIPVEQSAGRVLAAVTMSCPPAVPAVVCGEIIPDEAIPVLQYYGTQEVWVIT